MKPGDTPCEAYTDADLAQYGTFLKSLCKVTLAALPRRISDHTGKNSIICSVCTGAASAALSEFNRHLWSHRSEPTYTCTYEKCEYGCHQRTNMDNHIRNYHTHETLPCRVILRQGTGVTPPFVCGFSNTDNTKISAHRRKCHPHWRTNIKFYAIDIKNPQEHLKVPWNTDENRLYTWEETVQSYKDGGIDYDADALREVYRDAENITLTVSTKKVAKTPRGPRAPRAPRVPRASNPLPELTVERGASSHRVTRASARRLTEMPATADAALIPACVVRSVTLEPVVDTSCPTPASIAGSSHSTAPRPSPRSFSRASTPYTIPGFSRHASPAYAGSLRPASPASIDGSSYFATPASISGSIRRATPEPNAGSSHSATPPPSPSSLSRTGTPYAIPGFNRHASPGYAGSPRPTSPAFMAGSSHFAAPAPFRSSNSPTGTPYFLPGSLPDSSTAIDTDDDDMPPTAASGEKIYSADSPPPSYAFAPTYTPSGLVWTMRAAPPTAPACQYAGEDTLSPRLGFSSNVAQLVRAYDEERAVRPRPVRRRKELFVD
ncbi:hypothetical protein PHLGIDRAFT_119679 [Phlebiopsis gigantea 11061_1 CR5-6]|uniref:C2H2-type domain-containing protein n=1 Tax=Phlebiopsis gigantea (strain 11061_1 CR5-6) TaxID=745531 RepID=A0A0C3S8R8_PHLG1|nr:hypothetical protein PHLGIDRAFT_119679 [Phlebiopsis gigantea 11061_1 CR5-6]